MAAISSGRPSTRVVGIKGFDKSGFKIATNSKSVKAKQLVSALQYNKSENLVTQHLLFITRILLSK